MKAKRESSKVSVQELGNERILYLASLVDNISDALISTDMQFKVLEWNAAAEVIYGWTAAEVTDHPLQEFIQSGYIDATTWESAIRAVLKEGKWKGEVTQNRKDGTHFPVLTSVSLVKDETGKPIGFVTINRDITERKQAEKQIVQMKRLYATLSQVNQTIVRVKDQHELFETICRVAVEFGEFPLAWIGLLDHKSGEMTPVAVHARGQNKLPFQSMNVKESPYNEGLIGLSVRSGLVQFSNDIQVDARMEHWLKTAVKDDYHSAAAIPIRKNGQIVGVLNLYAVDMDFFQAQEEQSLLKEMGMDISFALDTMEMEAERSRTKQNLLESEEKFRTVANFTYDWEYWVGPDGQMIYVSPSCERVSGHRAEEFMANMQLSEEITHPDDLPLLRKHIKEEFEKEGSSGIDFRIQKPDGEIRWINHMCQLVRGTDGRWLGRRAANRDITERKQAEEELRAAQQLFYKTFDISPIASTLSTFPEGKALDINAAFEVMLGYTRAEIIGRSLADFDFWADPSERQRAFEIASRAGRLHDYEFQFKKKSGELGYALMNTEIIEEGGAKYLLTKLMNITERLQAEKKLEEQNLRLKVLREIDTAILASDSVENIVGAALDHIRELIDCERANLALIDWEKNEAVNFDVRDTKESAISKGARVSLDLIQDILHVLSQNQPVLMKDLTLLPDPPPQVKIFIKEGLRSRCILPLLSQGKLIGSFTLSSKISDYFDEEKVNLGREVANQVAIAISQSRLVASLRTSEEKYSVIFDRSPFALTLTKMPEVTIVGVNDAFMELFEFTRAEVIGKTSVELGIEDPESRTKISAEFQARGWVHDFEVTRNTKTGRRLDLALNLDWVTIGEEKYILTTIRDITERKQAQQRIEDLAKFPEENINPVLRFGGDNKLLFANRASSSLLTVWNCEIGGRPPEYVQQIISESRTNARNQEIEVAYKDVIVSLIIVPIVDKDYVNIYGRDITERKRAEDKLIQSETRYRRLFETAKDGILILNAKTGMIMDVNPFLITLLGYSKEDFLSKSIWDLGFFKDILASKANFLELQQMEYIRYEDLPLETASGRRISVEFVSNVYEAGHQKVIQCNVRDITERKQAEAQIQRQLQRLNSLRDIDTAISSSFDIHVTLDIVLQQVLSKLGVDAAAILLVNPTEQLIVYSASRGFRSNALQHTQLKLTEGFAGRAVRERQMVHILDLASTGGILAEALQSAHEDFVNYIGTPLIVKNEVKGVLEIYHRSPWNPDHERLDFLETLAGQAAIAIDNAQLFDNLQRSNAQLEQRVAKRTEELKKTNIELKHANSAKDEFLATMSHELRTPLNSILGLSESLLEQRRDPLSEYQQRSLQMIQFSGSHLLELINDILDLSKIEAGKFDYYPQIISVGDLCRSSLAFVKEQATRKSIMITYHEGTDVSKMYADPRRLKQILVNLLTNAVKFTPDHGQVTLQVHAEREQDRVQYSVIDTGIGIALEDLKQLFIPFKQVDSSLTRDYEGTGLGLALVQKLTDLHGGSVNVESEVGKGSRFTINLPLGRAMWAQLEVNETDGELLLSKRTGNSNTPVEEPLDHGIVLLAEDNLANILTIGDYLESHGYQVVVAHDGLEAMKKAGEIKPNIILMDIQMPAMDGLEAIRRLRMDPGFASTPIIALTALAMPGDRERSLKAGANEYMSKPVSLKEMVNNIRQLLSKEE